MILSLVINGFVEIIKGIINIIPMDPAPVNFMAETFITYTDLICENLGLIDIVIPFNTAKLMFSGIIVLLIAKFTYSIAMFVIHKIPFASIR